MKFAPHRHHLTTLLREMEKWGALNPAGGAISVRLGDGSILMSTTSVAFWRWHISERDFIVLTPDGDIVEQTAGLGASGTPIHLSLYRQLPKAGAIVHAHAPYSLVFASLGLAVPSVTNRADTLGDIPCLAADDSTIKRKYLANPVPLDMPAGVAQRPEVAAITLLHYEPQLQQLIVPRADELDRHGLAFTLYRHGAVTVGRQPDEAFDLLLRVEESARTALYQAQLGAGKQHIAANQLYPSTVYDPAGLYGRTLRA